MMLSCLLSSLPLVKLKLTAGLFYSTLKSSLLIIPPSDRVSSLYGNLYTRYFRRTFTVTRHCCLRAVLSIYFTVG
ncbi:hypothetical protein WN943_018626 [Citrus x changshan-huyou]